MPKHLIKYIVRSLSIDRSNEFLQRTSKSLKKLKLIFKLSSFNIFTKHKENLVIFIS